MNKHEAIQWVVLKFAPRSEWGAEYILFQVRKIARTHESAQFSRAELFTELNGHQEVVPVDPLSLQVCELMDEADRFGIRTVKLDGTEIL